MVVWGLSVRGEQTFNLDEREAAGGTSKHLEIPKKMNECSRQMGEHKELCINIKLCAQCVLVV